MKQPFLTMLAVMYSATIFAQTSLEGNITDSKSGEALPFVNIAISGTTVGTISDLNGEFKLNVPDDMINKELTISSVGYSTVSFSISKLQNQRSNIKLEPMDLKIEEVVVIDKSETGRKHVKNVLEKISANYVNTEFGYSGTYHNVYKSGNNTRTSDYQFNAYDSKGYSRGSSNNAFEALNYKFSKVNRDFKANDYVSGLNYFDLVSSLDALRYQLGVMNNYTLRDFEFSINSEDSQQCVIDFSCNKPALLNTGAIDCQKYSGTLKVSKSDNALLEMDCYMELKNFSPLGLTVIDKNISNTAVLKFNTKYIKTGGKYTVNAIKSNIVVNNSDGTSYTLDDNLIVTAVNSVNPSKILGKVFYTR